jgi:hypothetical protein
VVPSTVMMSSKDDVDDRMGGDTFTRLSMKFKKLYAETGGITSDIADMARLQSALVEKTELNHQYIPPRELANNMDIYPSVTHSFGGSLPLDAKSNKTVVVVQSSQEWKTCKYAQPQCMPSFRKYCKQKHDSDS